MNTALWIVAGLLSVAYLIGGGGKVFIPKEKIAKVGASAKWTEDFSATGVKAIGALEVLAAVGLILPAVLDIAPILVPLAALGLVILMAGAAITRLRRHEIKFMLVDLVYLVLAAFVAWGRFGPESFALCGDPPDTVFGGNLHSARPKTIVDFGRAESVRSTAARPGSSGRNDGPWGTVECRSIEDGSGQVTSPIPRGYVEYRG